MADFRTMSKEKHREICSKGGKAAHKKGTSHEWTPEEARRAALIGAEKRRKAKEALRNAPVVVTSGADLTDGTEAEKQQLDSLISEIKDICDEATEINDAGSERKPVGVSE